MRPIMPYYEPVRPQIARQYSGESERTDHLLVKHRKNLSNNYDNNSTPDDDEIFSGRHIRHSGTMGSKRSKSTPLTVEESLSGEYQQFGVQQPSMSYNDDGASYDPNAVGSHRGGASRSGNSYHSFQQGEYSYSGSFQDRDLPPEEQQYRDQYLSHEHDDGQCYTDDGEPYYEEDHHEQYDQRQQYHEDEYAYNGQRQPPPYDERGYHQGHPDDYPPEYHHHRQQQEQEQYPEEYDGDGYHFHGHPDEYGDYQQGHPPDYPPEYHEASSQDYSGYRQGYDGYDQEGHHQPPRDWPQPEEEYSHFDDQEESYVSYDHDHHHHPENQHFSSYEARQNAQGHWEESSEIMEGGTIASKTLNTNLEGMKYMPSGGEPYDSNYYGGEETAFDYSEGPSNERSESPEIPFNGASTLASPVHDDEGSHGSASIWDGMDLRNRSLMDNPVSPLSQTHFSIGNRTDYTGETRGTTATNTRRPVSKFIQKTKKNVGGCTGVTYGNGEFQVRTNKNNSKRGVGSRSNNKSKKGGESATILDIMFNVGHDLILGTNNKKSRDRRKRDPAAKIVDSFKEMFNCGVEEDDVDDYDDYESYRS